MRKERLKDIDTAKGLAIFLVVFGHIFHLAKVPMGHEWYSIIKQYLATTTKT